MKEKKSFKLKYIFIILLILIMIQIFRNPGLSIKSAKEGLDIWANLLLPSLLPFLIISNLLISLGFMDLFGRFLEPLMKPLFNVSGIGIFPFSISMISGYPVGAKLTSNLRENNLITKIEGDRLISFSSTSGPLFLLGTVLTGMLNAPELSPLILIPHYLGAITIGLIFRFYKKNDKSSIEHDVYNLKTTNNSIGALISGCIKDGIDSMLMIGGFVIIYSVIINIMFKSNLFNSILNIVSKVTFVDIEILKGIVAGIIELTNGCKMISSLNIKLINKILILNFLIGWGGFSIHSQALSFISNTDINSKIYLVSKFFHGALASFYTYLLYIFKYKGMLSTTFNTSNFTIPTDFEHWLSVLVNSAKITVTSFIFISILSILIKQLKVKN